MMSSSTKIQRTPKPSTMASNSDESMKLAIAMALLRSKFLRQPQSQPSSLSSPSHALRWKQKAKERKQEILRLTQDLKQAEDDLRGDLYPQSASCKCYFFNNLENLCSKKLSDGSQSDQRLSDFLRRRFLRQVRLEERKKRRTNNLTGRRAFADFHRKEEIQQLKVSAEFLVDLCEMPYPVKTPHFANGVHQAVDFIQGSLNHVLSMGKDLDLIEGVISSLITRLIQRMCTPLGEELYDCETDTKTHIQHIIRKLGSVSYVGQRVLFSVSHRISELAEKLLVLDPFDESFPLVHASMFVMIQLIEFLVSDYLVTWSKDESFETTLFGEWVASFLCARKALQQMEKRSGLYALYMDRVTGELAAQVGQISSLQNLNLDILDNLFS